MKEEAHYNEGKLYKDEYILFVRDIYPLHILSIKGEEIIRKTKLFSAVLITVMLIALMLFTSGCSQQEVENETENLENESENLAEEAEDVPQEAINVVEKSDRNIMQTLADRNFVTLVELINTAGLEQTLADEGIYTVFAPTDEAFAELPENEVSALKNNTEALQKVLTYHVVAGEILMQKDIENMTSVKTLEGGELAINVTENGIQVGGANITEADIMANNGVIHQIDKVLIPPQ